MASSSPSNPYEDALADWQAGQDRHQFVTNLSIATAAEVAMIESIGWTLDHMAVTFAAQRAFAGSGIDDAVAASPYGAVVPQ
ncbi:hypothetical protein ACFOYW_16430 [Gryllotalpicola reticulitermitis]|uniref:DUF664 domain-containing protein n=1 Tax=Gryllotalpicola reticulitermitis TaxID=1184153 RepID=A0ABV8Q9J1_9MICO